NLEETHLKEGYNDGLVTGKDEGKKVGLKNVEVLFLIIPISFDRLAAASERIRLLSGGWCSCYVVKVYQHALC
ncbi:hypothetical protein RYX36_014518, partial [Vicia faba]